MSLSATFDLALTLLSVTGVIAVVHGVVEGRAARKWRRVRRSLTRQLTVAVETPPRAVCRRCGEPVFGAEEGRPITCEAHR